MSDMKKAIRIGTRASKLALWQADWVADTLRNLYPNLQVELVKISTRGDRTLDVLIPETGGKGFFTEELDNGLLNGEIDLAVHSLKDLPTDLPQGLTLGAVCNRRWIHDVLLARRFHSLDELPYGAVVGTCSLRRTAQVKHYRSDLQIKPLRGNVPTRIDKLNRGEYDAIVLAEAGVRRLGLHEHIKQVISADVLLPAPAQGALGIELRAGNEEVRNLVAPMEEFPARATTDCERAVLHQLGAGCQVPVAALAELNGTQIHCRALIASVDGERILRDEIRGEATHARVLGERLARRLLQQGGAEILAEAKGAMTHV